MPDARPLVAEPPFPARGGAPDSVPRVDSTAAFALQVSRQFTRCRREGGQLALLWIEVDVPGVPGVPRVPGSAAGLAADEPDDDVIHAVTQRLRNRVRGKDQVFRVGEHGFAVLLADGAQAAAVVEQRLLQTLRGAYAVAGGLAQVAVQLGTAIFPKDGRNGAELAEAARRDLQARHQGKPAAVSSADASWTCS